MGILEDENEKNTHLSPVSCNAYEYMGVHRENGNYVFRVWAPNADRIFVIGSFCDWNEKYPMQRTSGGIWEARIEESFVCPGDIYKYKIYSGNKVAYKSDPYGYLMECVPEFASVIYDIAGFEWSDIRWLSRREEMYSKIAYHQPMNIYEIHAGSWKRREDGSFLSYSELAHELAPYVKQMGYTHIELMPITEYPSDSSWGYQVGGYYAPTSRYGDPKEFMEFIDIMHGAGIGVILDWVPAHFPKDSFGLSYFDGEPIYEYPDECCRSEWNTGFFDLSKDEVRSFLISNADFWIRKYHVDGLSVDAVGAMLALDRSDESEEMKAIRASNAEDFLKALNSYIKSRYPDVLMIAEDSSARKKITGFANGGLGFDLKWNMGWMYDTLWYADKDFWQRREHHGRLNFSLTYAFDEQFILPISHDDVSGGKRSFLEKMPDDRWRKFAGARVFYAYQMTHPGKKLSFMGNELATPFEWDFNRSIDWRLMEDDMHARYQFYCAELNDLYLRQAELWQQDCSFDGFRWIDADDSERSILSFRRIASDKSELIVVLNFTPNTYEDFVLKVPFATIYKEVFNSDDKAYGGSGVTNKNVYLNSKRDAGNNILRMRLPPLGVSILKIVGSNADNIKA